MNKTTLFAIPFMLINIGFVHAQTIPCTKSDMPRVTNPMADWDIIATNTANIKTATIFKGNHLTYSFTAHPHNKKNKIQINSQTGFLEVIAEKEDNFNIHVTAKNQCGRASNKFNIQIDEEE